MGRRVVILWIKNVQQDLGRGKGIFTAPLVVLSVDNSGVFDQFSEMEGVIVRVVIVGHDDW